MTIKVGTLLAFDVGRGSASGWIIHKVEEITPSGRIKVGGRVLNPDLTVRGGHGKAQLVTNEIRQSVIDGRTLQRVLTVDWAEQPVDVLNAVLKLVVFE